MNISQIKYNMNLTGYKFETFETFDPNLEGNESDLH